MSDYVSAKTIAALRGMSEEELIAAHDSIADLPHSVETAEDYRAELARRDADAQTRAMLALTQGMATSTKTMLCLTKVIAALTVVNVVLVACSVIH